MYPTKKNNIEQELPKVDEIELLEQLLDQAKITLHKAPIEAEECATKALRIARRLSKYNEQKQLHTLLGSLNFYKGLDKVAVAHFKACLEICLVEEDQFGLAQSYNNIGGIYLHKEQAEQALDWFIKALNQKDVQTNPAIYCNIGSTYRLLKKMDQAYDYFYRAIVAAKNVDYIHGQIIAHINISECLQEENKETERIHHLNKALELSTKHNIIDTYVKCMELLGLAHTRQQKYDKALVAFRKGIKKARKANLFKDQTSCELAIAKVYFDQKKYKTCLSQIEKVITTTQKYDWPDLKIEAMKLKQSCAFAQKDLVAAQLYSKELVDYLEKQKHLTDEDTDHLLQLKESKINNLVVQNQSFERQNKLILQSNEELKQYAYIIAHDLKEPLRNINGFAHLLEKKLKSHQLENHQFTKEITEYTNYIKGSTIHMSELMEDLLQYSTLQPKPEKQEFIDLNTFLSILLHDWQDIIKEKNLQINVHPLPTIHIVRKHCKQLFINLIQNAIKFNDKTQPIIEISYKEEFAHFKFMIKDNGIGIEQEYLNKIFKIFNRLKPRAFNGTGIGLAICTKIVQIYDGQIGVESKPNKGSTFYFTIAKKSPHIDEV